MESLCYSANKGSDDAYDVSTSLTFLLLLFSLRVDGDPLYPTGQIHLTRHCSCNEHLIIDVHTHCMAQDEPPNVSVQRALIPSSCLPRCVSFSCFSVVYLFSSLSYLHSNQHFLSNVNSVEGINH